MTVENPGAPGAPGAPEPAEAAPELPWRRLSRAMLLVEPVRELIRAIPLLIALIFAGHATGGPPWSLIGVAIVILRGVLRWFTTTFRITSDQLQLRRGLLRRRTLLARLDRVRTVDVSADVFQRALGLAKVEIGTGTSDRKKEAFAIDGVGAAEAQRLRAELLHRAPAGATTTPGEAGASGTSGASGASGASGSVGSSAHQAHGGSETVIVALRARWAAYGPFTLSGAFTALFLIGFGWRITGEAHLHPGRIGVIRGAQHHLDATPLWLDVIQVLVVVLVVVSILSTAGYVMSFWGFRLSRHSGGSLHVSRGLLTTRATSLEERRLRGIELSEPLLLRAVGGARAIAVATGLRVGRGAERGGTVLLPPAPREEALRVGADVLRDARPLVCELRGHPAGARRRRFTRALAGAVLVIAALGVLWALGELPAWAPVTALILLPLAALVARDRAANLGHQVLTGPHDHPVNFGPESTVSGADRGQNPGLDSGREAGHGWLVTRYGSLTRRRVALTTEGVIGVTLRQSWFQRRAGLVTLVATTAAGRQKYPVTDLAVGQAEALGAELLPGLLDVLRADAATVVPGRAPAPARASARPSYSR